MKTKKQKKQTPIVMDFIIFESRDDLFGKTVRRRVYVHKEHGHYIKYKGKCILLGHACRPISITIAGLLTKKRGDQ